MMFRGRHLSAVAALVCAASAFAAAPAPLSADAQALLQWVAQSNDNAGAPFMVIDKKQARLWVFDGQGRQHDSSPVLLGLARGDHTVPGIGERPVADVKPHERTTPAGRFRLEPGRNLSGEDILWVDYDAAVSMHRVRATNARERRLERLATPTPADNRISYGCINLPAAFYDQVVSPVFTRTSGFVYLLPETRPLGAVFPTTQTVAQHMSPAATQAGQAGGRAVR
jgi:hypothetical protein